MRTIDEEEWHLLRDITLRALQDSPGAFLSKYEIERKLDEFEWRRRVVSGGRWFLAFRGTEPVGVAGATDGLEASGNGYPHVISMWVDPQCRRTGVARRLLTSLKAQIALDGGTEIWLWVIEGNDGAGRAYERMGFAATGECQRLRGDPSRTEKRMRCVLTQSAPASKNGRHGARTPAPAAVSN